MSLASMLSGDWFEQLASAIPAKVAIEQRKSAPQIATSARIAIADPTCDHAANDVRAWNVLLARDISAGKITMFRDASEMLDAVQSATGQIPRGDPDRWCWPNSSAMTSAELFIAKARTDHFKSRGASTPDALADLLVQRDREEDDRHLCVECRHCRSGLRCSQGQAVLNVLQRCQQFEIDRAISPLCESGIHGPAFALQKQTQAEKE